MGEFVCTAGRRPGSRPRWWGLAGGGSWHLGPGSGASPEKTEEEVGSLAGLVSAVSQVGGPAQPGP